ncbi:hypothetical protein WR164_10170 [Philodulcilactobacillus myokoensis]|uniref:ABM domain-containing protein n=1 Tax=Philodulcilactobacillus myokoensis TaxID=2929573 RepID=A0A9W6B262_9LACO|nr:hypothetical protein [Philodulcilactobacillus myokoensis]GLB47038.1 hypothetical protein WR164_10170 [Philodulcilactobacillus myokoensis]
MKQINITFGSKYIVKQIIKKHPERKLFTFSSTGQDDNIMIMDFSNLKPIFKNPIKFIVNDSIIKNHSKPFISVTSMILNEDDLKQFDSQFINLHHHHFQNGFMGIYNLRSADNSFKVTILNIWNSYNNYKKSEKNDPYLDINRYDKSNNYFYQKNYIALNL